MWAGRSSRSWAAWVASALVHALVAALLLRAGDRAALRAPTEAVEFDIEVEDRAPSPPPRQADPSPLPSPRQADPSPLPSPRKARRGDQKEGPSASPSPSEEEPSPSRSPSPGQAGRGDKGADAPIDLSFGALPDEVKGRFAERQAPEGTLRARPHRFDVDELRVELERQQDAVANVDKGRADPLLYDYLRGARSRFLDDAEKLADDLSIGPGDMVRAWGRGYVATIDDINRGAYSTDAQREASNDARNEKSAGADALGGYNQARRHAERGAEQRRAEVCLNVAAGRETAVTLRRSSGNKALDRLTVESFTKSINARPVPADARRGLACYELRISAYRMPPLPFISCGVGRAGLTCVWPFKKVTSVRGRLLSVDYPPADGGGGSGRASPSLLRKPR